MKRLIALLMALVLVFSFAACSSTTEDEDTDDDTTTSDDTTSDDGISENEETVDEISDDATLTVALIEEPDFLLAPYGNPTEADSIVMPCLYNSLFTTDSDGNIVAEIAESYEWIDDTHIQITIRDDVVAYDGTTLTASDVIYTLQVGNTSDYAEYYQMYLNVDNCYVVDEYTVELELLAANPNFLFLLGDIPFYIIDESSVEASGGLEENILMAQCGTGRYTIQEWVSGQYITLVRNDDYWGDISDCYYKYITFVFISDSASRVLNVQSGDVDVAPMLAYADVVSVLADDSTNVYVTSSPRSVNITFNCADGLIFSNELLREAVYYAINSVDCAATLYSDYASTNELGVATSVYYYYDQSDLVEYNIEKAAECLEEAGYADGFEFTLLVEPGASYDVVAELIQAELLEVGITMNIENLELVDYFTLVAAGEYEAYIGTLSTGDCTTFLNQVDGRVDYVSAHGGTAYNDDELNEWIDLCYSTDEEESLEALYMVQQIAFEHHLYVGICDYTVFTVTDSSITNMQTTGFGYPLIYLLAPTAD